MRRPDAGWTTRASAWRTRLSAAVMILVLGTMGWAPSALAAHAEPPGDPSAGEPTWRWATDVTRESGIRFQHAANRATPNQDFIETTMGGSCWADADNDGRIDLFVTNSLGPKGEGKPALLRNAGPVGAEGGWSFVDVTETAGVGLPGMAQGCAWGDYDNDGWRDLFVSYAVTAYSVQTSTLWRSLGLDANGLVRFEDVSVASGIARDLTDVDHDNACLPLIKSEAGHEVPACFHTGVAWLDVELDGDLDLYVAAYAQTPHGACSPDPYPNPILCQGQPNRLYINQGDGTFAEEGVRFGADANGAQTLGRSLGVVAGDVNGDAVPDLYVANDFDRNALYLGTEGGTMRWQHPDQGHGGDGPKVSLPAGDRAGMGTAIGDLNNDGHADLLSTHLNLQYDAVLLGEPTADGTARFRDIGDEGPGLRLVARTISRWGGMFADLDSDGDQDYLVASGHQYNATEGHLHLLLQGGPLDPDAPGETLHIVRDATWPYDFAPGHERRNYRGLAFADYDDDGDLDVFAHALDGALTPGVSRLLRFETFAAPSVLDAGRQPPSQHHHYLRVELETTDSARDPVGARVRVDTDSGASYTRWRVSGGSYLDDHDPRLLFGLGDDTAGTVTVVWPGGARQGPIPFVVDEGAGMVLRVREDNTRPPAPTDWSRQPTPGAVGTLVAWRPTFVNDFASYRVDVGLSGRPGAPDARVESFHFEDRATAAQDLPVDFETVRWLQVRIIDEAGHVSEPSGTLWPNGEPQETPGLGFAALLIASMLLVCGLTRRARGVADWARIPARTSPQPTR